MNKAQNHKAYKPVYQVRKNTGKARQIQKATQKLSVQSIRDICLRLGFDMSLPQLTALHDYIFLLQKWNQSMNLVGKNSWEDILTELVVDSLHLAKYLSLHPIYGPQDMIFSYADEKIHSFQYYAKNRDFEAWDLGAGAGLPGIPLRILWNQGNYTLVEVREKRSLFLNMACTKLGLENTFVCRDRAENFMQDKKAHLIVSRAFMPYEKMLPFVAPYLDNAENNASVIFLTLEKIDAKKYSSQEYQWNTKNIYEYSVKNSKKYFCEIEKI